MVGGVCPTAEAVGYGSQPQTDPVRSYGPQPPTGRCETLRFSTPGQPREIRSPRLQPWGRQLPTSFFSPLQRATEAGIPRYDFAGTFAWRENIAMSHSYTSLLTHVVFSTKDRKPF